MNGIYGNKKLFDALFGAITAGKAAGCYIIEGIDGSGKTEIARLAAAYLCCETPIENAPCLKCKNCINILSGCHIDVAELEPAEEGKKIPVDAIREMLRKSFVKPNQANYRVFIIKHSEEMKKEAQNALLKSIEEPMPNTVFFLLTNDISRLLPTVRSRAVKLSTDTFSNEIILKILKDKSIDIDLADIPPSLLSVGNAIKILNDESYSEKRKTVQSYFEAILRGDSFSNLCSVISPNSVKRPEFKEYLTMIKAASRDILIGIYKENNDPSFFADKNFLSDLSSVASPIALCRLFDFCDDLLIANESNVNIFSAVSELHMHARSILLNHK